MKLKINKKQIQNKDFAQYIADTYLLNKFLGAVDLEQLKLVSNALSIDCFGAIKFALNNLIVSDSQNEFVISIDKNLSYKKWNLETLINQITFGSLSVKGYDILYDIFIEVAENIELIYEQWMDGAI